MKKRKKQHKHVVQLIIILGVVILFVIFNNLTSTQKPTTKTRAAANSSGGNIVTVSGSTIQAIQQVIEGASNGDIINIPAGNYVSNMPVVTDPNYKYQTCLIHTRSKNLTLRGLGNVVIDNQNGGLNDESQKTWSTGICVLGGNVTIDNISVKQTLRPGMVVWGAQAVIRNFKTIDIDNAAIDVNNSQVIIANSVFWPGIGVGGDQTKAVIEHNTFFGGITINLCKTSAPIVEFNNNVIVRGGISLLCPEQSQRMANIKSVNNFVYHGSPTGDQLCVSSGNTQGESCGTNELCEGVTFTWPGLVGADENGTVCAWGEGWMQGDINTKGDSPATKAGAGVSTGPCSNPTSPACETYIKSKEFTQPPTITPEEEQPLPPETQPPDKSSSSSTNQSSSFTNVFPTPTLMPREFSLETNETIRPLFIVENMGFGTIQIKKIVINNTIVPPLQTLETEKSVQFELSPMCSNSNEVFLSSILYTDERENNSLVNIQTYCNKINVFDIE